MSIDITTLALAKEYTNRMVGSGGTGGGVNGKDGITPHIGDNGNWFIGTVDTGISAQGPAGENGVTPHIGTNGNWYIGSVNTGVSAKGAKGDNGLDGNGIKSAILNSDYTLTLTFDDGTTYTTPSIRGATGSSGKDGPAGAAGKDGTDGVGIASIEQTATSTADGGNNVFTVTLTNGTTATFTVKNGSKGSTGKDGSNGVDGGHYTPVVTQPTTDTMQISFAPSKSDMPAVNPVTVNLPVSENSGQNLNLDTTLTKSGEAADAKVTGDEIKRVEGKIPSIEGLAKTEEIPTKPEDIGAQPQGNYLTKAPVESVNGKTGAVQLDAAAVGARPDSWIPTAQDVGALPSTYTPPNQTAEQVGADPKGTAAGAVSAHNTSTDAHTDLRLAVQQLQKAVEAFMDVDDATRNSLSEVLALIDANADVIESITTGKVSVSDIINNLTTNVANKPLSAAQGVAIKALIDGLASGKLDASKLSEAINTALAQAKANGEFDGAKGDPGRGIKSIARTSGNGAAGTTDTYTITYTDDSTSTFAVRNGSNGTPGEDGRTPVLGKDYWTDADKAEIEAFIAAELAKRGQLRPEPAQSLEWLKANGDTSKIYVLPDGYLYMWVLTEKEVDNGPTYTNRLPLAINADGTPYVGDNGEKGYRVGYRYSASSAAEKAATGFDVLGFIPAKAGDIIRIKNVTQVTSSNDGNSYAAVYFFTSSFAKTTGTIEMRSTTYADGVHEFTIPTYNTIAYFKATLKGVSANTIVTVNEEITEGGGTEIVKEYAWANTGIAFVSTDYGPRVTAVEKQVAENTADIAKLKNGVASTTPIKTWDAPIYDANIPVFELSAEKDAITEAEKTVAGVYAKYDALMARHPQYITKTDLGMCSDGVTPVYRYDFREPEPHRGTTGKKEWSETKAKAIIVSGIHWEWGGIFALYNALEELSDNPDLFALRRNTHLIVLPICNPYAVANMSVRNANLVEIHRNFEVDFIYPGESGYIELGERSHGGTEPLSEVETQYMDTIMRENQDAAFFLTCHSYQSDSIWGTGFLWASPATYYCCNLAYRVIDKESKSWMDRFGDELAAGIADYRTENLPEWDTRFGSAYLSTTNGTETKQATKYGIQAINLEVCDTFWAHGTKASPATALDSFAMSRGAEAYVNLFLTAFGVYDPKGKKEYAPTTV